MALPNTNIGLKPLTSVQRIRIWYGLLLLVVAIFVVRLFYIQVIRYDHYKTAALNGQLKQYDIPAARGIILARDGSQTVPIVLNVQLYTLYADPTFIKSPDKVAIKLASIIGGNAETYRDLLSSKSRRYVILAKKITGEQQARVLALKYPGVGAQAQNYRTYPQGALAAQELGFVSDSGVGEYGVEQALNSQLSGVPGQLKAITDVSGVPLAASRDNVETQPVDGQDVTLTIDLAMQHQLEAILARTATKTKTVRASAVIMDVKTGAIRAMANFPTFDPAKYYDVEDSSVFQNAAVSDPIEPGSIMKVLTTAAGIDQGAFSPNVTYYDPGRWVIDGFTIKNIEEDGGAGTKSLTDLLNLSLNTGATWELMQMGGGEINTQARARWYDYLANRYMFGKATGIEQGYESPGLVTGPKDNGSAINLTYAETAFGQAILITPVQMAAALSTVLNGGTYYQPRLVDSYTDTNGKTTPVQPKIVRSDALKVSTGQSIIPMLQYSIDHHGPVPAFDQNRYIVGGKTGTAELAVNGVYSKTQYNGTYLGFVGGNEVEYVICVYMQKPVVDYYAGTAAAQPVFVDLAHMLINNSYVTPKH
ncbi:MAG: penicillin-binding protein 2 [Candidatus Saccharimonadales bacterium]